jgi:hypothetical protein
MDDPRGRQLMWERLNEAGLFRSSFNTDPCASDASIVTSFLGYADVSPAMSLI